MFKKIVLVFAMLTLVVGTSLSFGGCSPKTEPTTNTEETLLSRISALETLTTEIKQTVDQLPSSSSTANAIAQVQNDVALINGSLNSVKTQVANLQNTTTVDLEPLEDSIESVASDVGALQNTVTLLNEALSELQDDSSIGELELQLGVMSDMLSSLGTTVGGLNALSASLAERIEAVEQQLATPTTTPPTTTTSPITPTVQLEVIKYGEPRLLTGSDAISYLFRLNVTNTSPIALSDVGVVINFIANNVPPFLSTDLPTLTGSTVVWGRANVDTGLVQFVSGWGSPTPSTRLSLNVGETKSFYLTLVAKFDSAATTTQAWTLESYLGYAH